MQATRELTVTPELTVRHAYPSLPEVFATPQMIYLMEMAAADAIATALPDGWNSVGTLVDVTHLAATPVDMRVKASAEVVEIKKHHVRFRVEAFDEREKIGEGFHERGVVELARFVKGVEKKQL